MRARMPNPATVAPDAMGFLMGLNATLEGSGVPVEIVGLVQRRVDEIRGCSTKEAWREASYCTPAERAALALAEAMTLLAEGPEVVSDAVWAEAAQHYDEKGLAVLLFSIALSSLWNPLDAATRQVR